MMTTKRAYRIGIVSLLLAAWLLTGTAVWAQGPDGGEQDCLACHRQPNLNGVAGTQAEISQCLECHSDPEVNDWAAAGRTPVYIDEQHYAGTLHHGIACTACHSDVARNPHQAAEPVACTDCHATLLTHVNMGAPHVGTDCAACHWEGLDVVREAATAQVVLAERDAAGDPLNRTAHDVTTDVDCEKCHTADNRVGAPALALPPRSVICMACHDASPTVGIAGVGGAAVTDFGSIIGLLIFTVGVVVNFSIYLRGEVPGHPGLTTMQKLSYLVADFVGLLFSRRVGRLLWGLITEGIFLRRVLRESVGRWVMHTLIFWPFLGRFLLGLLTWMGEAFWPSAAWTQVLADKNAPGVAFAYDFLAALVIVGVLYALYRRFIARVPQLRTGSRDRLMIFLLAALFLLGLITEGVRLLNTGTPPEVAVYSFLGYGVAWLLRPLNLTWSAVYPVLWYLHGWLAAATVAYLPFSKFMHIFAGPFIASVDAAVKGAH